MIEDYGDELNLIGEEYLRLWVLKCEIFYLTDALKGKVIIIKRWLTILHNGKQAYIPRCRAAKND
jgi:hypothetical protein